MHLPVAGLVVPLFGPVTAVTITCSGTPVVRMTHISTSGSPSGTVMLGLSIITIGTTKLIV